MHTRRAAGWSIDEIAEAAGVSARIVYKWLARPGAENRPSRAHRGANRLNDSAIARIAELRRRRLTGAAIACRLGLPRSTLADWLRRLGMNRLARLEQKPPAVRYKRAKAGEIIHVDTK